MLCKIFGNRIYSEWLPNSGYEHAMLPEIEYYSAGDMMAADYKSEIWIPVKNKIIRQKNLKIIERLDYDYFDSRGITYR